MNEKHSAFHCDRMPRSSKQNGNKFSVRVRASQKETNKKMSSMKNEVKTKTQIKGSTSVKMKFC